MQMFQMVSQLKNSPNPMSAIEKIYGNNPMFKQAQAMVQDKSPEEISQTIQNVCKTKGIDYNQVKALAQNFGVYI